MRISKSNPQNNKMKIKQWQCTEGKTVAKRHRHEHKSIFIIQHPNLTSKITKETYFELKSTSVNVYNVMQL